MFKRKRQTVELAKHPNFVAPDGDVLPPALNALRPSEPRPYVVQANNAPAPFYAWAITAGVVVFFPAIFAGVILALGAPAFASLISWTVGVVFFGYIAMLVMSGDWPSLSEIRHSHRTRRKEIDGAMEAIRLHYSTRQQEIEAEKEIEIARIAATATDDNTHRIIMGMQATLARLTDALDVRATIAQPATYVHATPNAAVSAAKRWVAEQMATSTDGTAPSIAKVAMPWNAEWKAQPWTADARQWLLDNVLEQHGTVYKWRDEFATVASAQDALRRL
ncbi:MAG: hypothetical protein KDE20_15160 [Caldilineaceae bacterium]|nr:hypothetical protein [Caldilineaceae bacterium]